MPRPQLDWKNQPGHIIDWVGIAIAIVLIGLYLYQGLTSGQSRYSVIAVVFFAWLAAFFTDYWQPMLYLLMAIFVVTILILGVGTGFFDLPLGQITIPLAGIFVLVIVYLYFAEEPGEEEAETDR